jgi:hypothetical protein
MRLLELRLVEDRGSMLGLHPHLSVVTGLSADARTWLVRALPELLRGTECGLGAQVERDGRLDDLGPGGREAPLQGLGGADTLVRRDDLIDPVAVGPRGPSRRSGGTATATAPAATDELTRALAGRAAAQTSVVALQQASDTARAEYLAACDARARAEAAVVGARRDLDPYGAAALETARQAAARAEVESGVAPGACRADTLASVKERIVVLEGQFRDMTTALDMLAGAEPESVAHALDVVRVVTATGPIAPPEATRLADEWLALREHLAALEAKIAADQGGVQSVSDRLEAARARLTECEDALMPVTISDADVRALEEAHEAVLAAERKASGRLSGARHRVTLDLAITAEQAILDRLGYPTWSSWIMGAQMLDSTAEHGRRFELAQRDLDDATYAWEALSARLEADPEFCGLLDRLERVLEDAHGLVGEVDDVEQGLRDLRVDPGPPPCTVADARRQLADALTAVGVDTEPDASLDELRLHAERWLAHIRAFGSLRRQIEIDREHCTQELEIAREAYDRIDALGPVEVGDGFGGARLAGARAALLAAEARVNRHRSALSRVAHLMAEAGGLAELERQLALKCESKDELLALTTRIEDRAATKIRALSAQRREADAANAPAPFNGSPDDVQGLIDHLQQRMQATRALVGDSVPFLFDDSLAALAPEQTEHVMRWLVSASDETQIIYVTDDPDVVTWASRRSPEYVAVVRGSGFFA